MGATCCKCVPYENRPRLNKKRFRDYFVAKLRCFRRNRVESILIRQISTDGSEVNTNRCQNQSTRTSPFIVATYDTVGVGDNSSHVGVVANDQLGLDVITLDNTEVGNGQKVTLDTKNKKVRPKAAKGGRSITQVLPNFVQELEQDVELLLKGNSFKKKMKRERSLETADGVLEDFVLPGEVIAPEKYPSQITPSRPQLTVPALKTTQQILLDHFMLRQIRKELDIDNDGHKKLASMKRNQ